MNTCGDCKYINGVFLSQGFCDKHFHDVQIDRPACSYFRRMKKKLIDVANQERFEEPQPIVIVQHKTIHKTGRSHSLLKRLTHEERLYLITHYLDTPMNELAEKFGVSKVCLLRTIKKMGLKTRRKGVSTNAGKLRSIAGLKKYYEKKKRHE